MALTFNGSTSKLVGANIITGYPFSMFAWIRPNSLTTDQMVMGAGDFGGATEAAMFAVGATTGDPLRAFSRTTGGSSSVATSSTGMALATWQPCLVVFRSNNSRTVYFADGAAVTAAGSNSLGFGNFDRFVIGQRPISATLPANMDIAHAAVWATELQPDDWLHLRLGTVPSDIQPDALTDYWELATSGATQTGINGTVLTATDTATAGTSPTMDQAVPDDVPVRDNGIWTWFTEPRAVYYNGATYIGWVDSFGSIGITKFVHATKFRSYFVLSNELEVDDHDNASVYIRPDGRIVAFYSKHNDAAGLRYRISTNAEDISEWGAEATIDADVAYSNPRYLSGNDRLYVHYRRSVSDQWIAYSDDDGATWSTPTSLFTDTGRPYVKSITNGVDRIDFYLTNGQPGEAVTSIYHCMAKLVSGVLRYYKSDGTTELTSFPIGVSTECTRVYDSSVDSVSAWNWDAKYGADGHPRILFARGVSASDQRYLFSRWTGSAWTAAVEISAGGAAMYAGQPDYAHGICFDADDINAVYLSIEASGINEIERWTTSDNGATWAKDRDVTTGSAAGIKNARPIAPINAGAGLKLLWFKGTYTSYTNYNTDIVYEVVGEVAPEVNLQGAAIGSAQASAGASLTVPLTGAALTSSVANGELSLSVSLSGAAFASALATAQMTHGVSLTGSATAGSLAAATLSLSVHLTGSAVASVLASAAISKAANLSGSATASSQASGELYGSASLSGAAIAGSQAGGSLSIAIPLTAQAAANALANGALSVRVNLSGSAITSALAGGQLIVPSTVVLQGAAVAGASASAALSTGSAKRIATLQFAARTRSAQGFTLTARAVQVVTQRSRTASFA